MKVDHWLQLIGKNAAWLAKETGRNPGTISKIVAGKVTPCPETMEAIWRLSKGIVTPNDYYIFMEPPTPNQEQHYGSRSTTKHR